MAAFETTPTIHEKPTDNLEIPKSREIFSGDINKAVIAVQEITGFPITQDWWFEKVGNEGTTESILERFDTAFEAHVREETVTGKAQQELQAFDETFGDHPGSQTLRQQFVYDLKMHLVEKYFPDDETAKWQFEKRYIDELLQKYPEHTYERAFEYAGVEVVACGREIMEHEQMVIQGALTTFADKIGQDVFEEKFAGIQLYAGDKLIDGGGLALPRFDAVVVDLEKIGVSITQMEDLNDDGSDNPSYKKGDQARLIEGPDTYEALELGIVHELGHILEYRLHGDVDVAFAELDQGDAPTHYGAKSPREDYAESIMYYIYGGKISAQRRDIIQADIL